MRVRIGITALVLFAASCMNSEYRFDRIDGASSTPVNLKFESMTGVRDGDSVKAEARFTGEAGWLTGSARREALARIAEFSSPATSSSLLRARARSSMRLTFALRAVCYGPLLPSPIIRWQFHSGHVFQRPPGGVAYLHAAVRESF